ncbi:hypothetical protein ES703_26356 [subsurface metagenome]
MPRGQVDFSHVYYFKTPTALVRPGSEISGLESLEIVRGDITNPESLEAIMSGHDAVIHLAAAVRYGLKWKQARTINE